MLLRSWGFQKVQLGGLFINGMSVKMAQKLLLDYGKEHLTMQKNIEKTMSMYIYLMRKLMTNPFLKITWNPMSKFLIKQYLFS